MAIAPTARNRGRHRGPGAPKPLRWYGVVGRVVAWSIAGALFALIFALVVIPRVAGATPYTILTSSMAPALPPGTVVVDRVVPFSTITVGEVLTYQLESGQPAVVTHRVVGINIQPDGSRTLTMRGDANPSPDVRRVIARQVRGIVWYSIPLVGYIGTVGSVDARSVVARVVGVALVLYAACVAIAALVRRRNRPRNPPSKR